MLAYFGFLYYCGHRFIDDSTSNPEINWHIECNDNHIRGDISGLTHFLMVYAAAADTPYTYTALGANTITVNDIKTDDRLGNTVTLCETSGSVGNTRYTMPEFSSLER